MEVKECYKDPLGPGSNLVSSPTSAPFTADDPMTPSSDLPSCGGGEVGVGSQHFFLCTCHGYRVRSPLTRRRARKELS